MKLSWKWWKFFRIFHRFRRITRLSLVVMIVLHVDSFFNLRKWQHLGWPCFSADSFSRPISGGLTTTFARMTSWRRIGSRLPSQVGITWYELTWSNDSNLLLAAGWCRGMRMDWYELQDWSSVWAPGNHLELFGGGKEATTANMAKQINGWGCIGP